MEMSSIVKHKLKSNFSWTGRVVVGYIIHVAFMKFIGYDSKVRHWVLRWLCHIARQRTVITTHDDDTAFSTKNCKVSKERRVRKTAIKQVEE